MVSSKQGQISGNTPRSSSHNARRDSAVTPRIASAMIVAMVTELERSAVVAPAKCPTVCSTRHVFLMQSAQHHTSFASHAYFRSYFVVSRSIWYSESIAC